MGSEAILEYKTIYPRNNKPRKPRAPGTNKGGRKKKIMDKKTSATRIQLQKLKEMSYKWGLSMNGISEFIGMPKTTFGTRMSRFTFKPEEMKRIRACLFELLADVEDLCLTGQEGEIGSEGVMADVYSGLEDEMPYRDFAYFRNKDEEKSEFGDKMGKLLSINEAYGKQVTETFSIPIQEEGSEVAILESMSSATKVVNISALARLSEESQKEQENIRKYGEIE